MTEVADTEGLVGLLDSEVDKFMSHVDVVAGSLPRVGDYHVDNNVVRGPTGLLGRFAIAVFVDAASWVARAACPPC